MRKTLKTTSTNSVQSSVRKNLLSGASFTKSMLAMMGVVAALVPANVNAQTVGDYESFSGGEVIRGAGTIQENFGSTDVHTNTKLSVFGWQSTNVGEKASLNITSDKAGSISAHINKGNSTNASQILGTINSDGQVVIVDRNGVVFGKNSVINTQGIVASTGELNIDKFMDSGKAEFSNFNPDSSIVNYGTITVAQYGLAAFVAPNVANHGIITAKMGKVQLAGTTQVTTLDLYGDGLVEIALDEETAKTFVENTGTLSAEGGLVALTATAARGVVDNIINMEGVVSAASAEVDGGKIVLGGSKNGGTVRVAGTLDASGKNGGSISVDGYEVGYAADAVLDASGFDGNGGSIVSNATTNALFNGVWSATGANGEGGFIETSAKNEVDFGDAINVNVGLGGTWLIDPTNIDIDAVLAAALVSTMDGGGAGIVNTASAGLDDGNITFSSDIIWTGLGSLSLIADNNIVLTHLIDSAYATNNGTRGAVSLVAGGDINGNGGVINTVRGNVSFDAAGKINLVNTDINSTSGSIVLDAGNTFKLDGSDITTTKDLSLISTGLMTIKGASQITATNRVVDVDANNGLVLQQNSKVTAKTLDIDAKRVTQDANATIDVVTLQGTVRDGATFAGTNNKIAKLGNFDTGTNTTLYDGGFTLNDSDAGLDVAGIVTSTGGDVNITTTGTGNVRVTATGSVTSQGGAVNLTANDGNAIVLGSIDATGSDGSVFLTGKNVILSNGSVVRTEDGSAPADGSLTLTATDGVINQVAGSQIITGSLSGSATKNANVLGATNQIATIGNFATGQAGIHAGGLRLNEGLDGFDVTGTVSSQGGKIDLDAQTSAGSDMIVISGAVNSNGGNLEITNTNGRIRVANGGAIDAGTGDVKINTSKAFQLRNNTTLNADDLDIVAAHIEQHSGSALNIDVLTGSITRDANLAGTGNQIARLGAFATGLGANQEGGLNLVDSADGLRIFGDVSSTGGDISITTSGGNLRLDPTRTVSSGGGAIDLSTDADVDIRGTVDATGSDGSITLSGVNVILGNGSLVKTEDGTAPFDGVLTVNATGDVTQAIGSTIVTGLLTGSSSGLGYFRGTANEITSMGDFAAGGEFILNDSANGLDVTGNVSTAGNNVTIDTVGDLDVTGSVNANGGDVALSQTGIFTGLADSVLTSGTGAITLQQNDGGSVNNAVQAIENTGTGLNTINVAAGNYVENIVVSEDNFLLSGAQNGVSGSNIARGVGESVLSSVSGDTLDVTGDNVTVDGFTFTAGVRDAIDVDGSSGNKVENLSIVNNVFTNIASQAINADHVVNFNVANNSFNVTGNDAVNVNNGNTVTISDNQVTDAGTDAIDVNRVAGLTVVRNAVSSATQAGVKVANSSDILVGGSLADANSVVNSGTGVVIGPDNTGTTEVSFNTLTDNTTGVLVDDDDNVTVTLNTITGGSEGVVIDDARGSIITDNVISGQSTAGFVLQNGANNTTLTGNTFASSPLFIANYVAGTTLQAANNTFDGFTPSTVDSNNISAGELANLFALEDKTEHRLDNGGYGLVRYVDDNLFVTQDSGSIQRGVNASGSGDTLWVDAGTFTESVTVNKALTLFGAQYGVAGTDAGRGVGETIVSSGAGNQDTFNLDADNITLDGFTISGGRDGVDIDGTNGNKMDNISIVNNVFSSTGGQGINADHVRYFNVADNSFTSTGGDSVNVNNGVDVDVTNNQFTDAGGDAFEANQVTGLNIFTNIVNGASDAGFEIRNSSNVLIGGSLGNMNMVDGTARGVFINGSNSSVDIAYNTFSNNDAGVSVVGDNYVDIDNNTFTSNTVGVNLDGADDTDVTNNTFTSTDTDVVAANDTDDLYVAGNTFGGVNGVSITGGDDAVIEGNTFNNDANGVQLFNTVDARIGHETNSVLGNTFNGVENAIYASGSEDTVVAYNTITGADTGVEFDGGVGGLIVNNSIDGEETTIIGGGTVCLPFFGCFTIPGVPVTTYGDTAVVVNNQSGVNVDTNTINGFNTGVSASSAASLDVDNNTITKALTGISVLSSTGLNIEDNTVDGGRLLSSNGIYVEDSYNARIGGFNDANTVSNFATGIRVVDSGSADVERNNVSNFWANGIHVSGSNWVDIKNNTVSNGIGNGIYNANSNDAEINNNIIDDIYFGNGILVNPSDDVDVIGNEIHDVAYNGIKIENGSDAYIYDNEVGRAGRDGINVDGNSDVRIVDNYVFDSGDNGIEVSDSLNADIIDNVVEGSDTDGINLSASFRADVRGNVIDGAGDDGIDVSTSGRVDIVDNEIDNADDDGIIVTDSDEADLIDNNIHDVDGNGIKVSGGTDAYIFDNHIGRTGNDGIDVEGNSDVRIVENEIHDAGDDGIDVEDSFNADIIDNEVEDSNGDGIELSGSYRADVRGNQVYNSGDDGIDVANSSRVDIVGNYVDGTDGNGIEVSGSNDADIEDNDVTGAGDDGINVSGGSNAYIAENTIFGGNGGFFRNGQDGAGRDGIHVEGNSNVEIYDNTVRGGNVGFFSRGGDGAGRDAIHVEDSFNADITFNIITDGQGFLGLGAGDGAGRDGIFADNIAFGDVRDNNIDHVGDDGIDVRSSFRVDVNDNFVSFVDGDGIQLRDSGDADLVNNWVFSVGDDGIDVENSSGVVIDANTVTFADGNGIEVEDSSFASITGNTANFNGGAGIFVDPATNITVDGNTANNNIVGIHFQDITTGSIINNTVNNNDVGIFLENSQDITIGANTSVDGNATGVQVTDSDGTLISNLVVTNSVSTGVLLDGDTTNTTILNSTISNSGEYGIFAQGAGIGAVTLAGNTLNNNDVQARFESGLLDLTDLVNPNTLNGGRVGLQFELVGSDAYDLALVDDTFGATEFFGQSQYYIELQDGAFFDPVVNRPLILNALDANFDGIIPNNSSFGPGILTFQQFLDIQAKLYDLNDEGNRGLIFAGFVPGLSEEDIFSTALTNFVLPAGGFSVTLAGLPFISSESAAALNALATAAGGESDEDLANIETAAGGDDGACWNQVGSALNGQTYYGKSVTFNFGGDTNETLNDEAKCAQ